MNIQRICIYTIILLVLSCYYHTVKYPWHLDDHPNITDNPPIQITELSPQTLWNSIFAKPYTGKLGRPVSYFSFAINYYLTKENVVGYHLTNILIHLIASCFLFFTIHNLLNSPTISKPYSSQTCFFVAFLATALWALHPIQTQAITYIVQRMASLAGMWSIICIYLFIKSFKYHRIHFRVISILGSLLCFIFALGSKENAALLPFSLLIIQVSFYHSDTRKLSISLKWTLYLICALIFVGSLYYFYSHGIFRHLISSDLYGSRPYTALERLLTQPRILLFYISLLIYPVHTRFSVDHSFELSTSLFEPWTTLPSILIITFLLFIGFILLKKKPLLGFPIVFFLINHIIESSVIPLEIIFEHRNYLPSFFFFLPIALLISSLITQFEKSTVSKLLVSFSIALILLFCWSTYLRNTKWQSEEILWQDALTKAPLNARPYSYLGRIYGWEKPKKQENLDQAVYYYEQAIGKYSPKRSFNAAIIGNIGGIYFNYQKYDDSERYYRDAVNQNQNLSKLRYGLAQSLVMQGRFEEALIPVNYVLDKGLDKPNDKERISRFFSLKGLIHLWLDNPEQAHTSFNNAIANTYNKKKHYYNLAISLSLTDHYSEAKDLFQKVLKDTPTDIAVMFSIIENEIRNEKFDIAKKYSSNLYRVFSVETIHSSLKNSSTGVERYRSAPINSELIRSVVLESNSTREQINLNDRE